MRQPPTEQRRTGAVLETLRDILELGSYAVTVVALPFAVWVFVTEQRKEREN